MSLGGQKVTSVPCGRAGWKGEEEEEKIGRGVVMKAKQRGSERAGRVSGSPLPGARLLRGRRGGSSGGRGIRLSGEIARRLGWGEGVTGRASAWLWRY